MKSYETFLAEATKIPKEASEYLIENITISIEWHKDNMYTILNNIDIEWSKEADKIMEREWKKSPNKDDYDDAIHFGYSEGENIKWPAVTKYAKKAMKETPLVPYFCIDPTNNVGPKSLRADPDGFGGGGYESFGDKALIEENNTLLDPTKMPISLFYDSYIEDGNISTYGNPGERKTAIAIAQWLDPKSKPDSRFVNEVIENLVDMGMDEKSAKAVMTKPLQGAKDVFAEIKSMI